MRGLAQAQNRTADQAGVAKRYNDFGHFTAGTKVCRTSTSAPRQSTHHSYPIESFHQRRYIAEMASMSSLRDSYAQQTKQLADGDERAARSETQLRIEHEWRVALQATELKCKDQVAHMQQTIQHLQSEAKHHERVRLELDKVRLQWSEAQTTLEELGIQLSVSKLQVSELQDKANGSNAVAAAGAPGTPTADGSTSVSGQWTPDKMTSNCRGCNREFSITRRKVSVNSVKFMRTLS